MFHHSLQSKTILCTCLVRIFVCGVGVAGGEKCYAVGVVTGGIVAHTSTELGIAGVPLGCHSNHMSDCFCPMTIAEQSGECVMTYSCADLGAHLYPCHHGNQHNLRSLTHPVTQMRSYCYY